ncbi:hypothetical protein GCM10023322_83420 [Rugosimonospora acidiphila]|uniref:Uncharacterized protein n=1 Tax=Rugosimonospora acidiphila TaxID=556531 RepID=A0ABP9STM5_9ACTN
MAPEAAVTSDFVMPPESVLIAHLPRLFGTVLVESALVVATRGRRIVVVLGCALNCDRVKKYRPRMS